MQVVLTLILLIEIPGIENWELRACSCVEHERARAHAPACHNRCALPRTAASNAGTCAPVQGIVELVVIFSLPLAWCGIFFCLILDLSSSYYIGKEIFMS